MPDQDEQEIRAMFREWMRASSAKDIDGAMKPIAQDIVSYEHEAPLQYLGIDNVRQVCQRGFDAIPGDFTWNIPDLRVLVRGDIAVTWGLNQMRSQQPGQPPVDTWSRGTRIFRKVGNRWQMIHQHVSFPYDPQTGHAALDVKPSTAG
jgi:ketosteroid isomerase-like protein